MKSNLNSENSGPHERALWGDLSSIAFVFPVAITLGFFSGKWIGGWFGRPVLGQWIGLGWGIASAFWELFKTSQRLNSKSSSSKEK
ncbi:MAG: AtpZ/AtpI family protein [Holophagaceae bacterium]